MINEQIKANCKDIELIEDETMTVGGIYRDENKRYHRLPRSKEEQEMVDDYIRLKRKNIINSLRIPKNFFENPQECMEKLLIFLAEHNKKRPDPSEAKKLIDKYREMESTNE